MTYQSIILYSNILGTRWFHLNINSSKTKPFQEPIPSVLSLPKFFLNFQKLSNIHSYLPTNLKVPFWSAVKTTLSHIAQCSAKQLSWCTYSFYLQFTNIFIIAGKTGGGGPSSSAVRKDFIWIILRMSTLIKYQALSASFLVPES